MQGSNLLEVGRAAPLCCREGLCIEFLYQMLCACGLRGIDVPPHGSMRSDWRSANVMMTAPRSIGQCAAIIGGSRRERCEGQLSLTGMGGPSTS